MLRSSALLLVSIAGLASLSCAGAEGRQPRAPVSAASAAAAQAAFARLAALEGEWVGEGLPDVPGPMTVTYAVTGGGSAVIESLFAGTPSEMVTVYTVEDGALMLTHYCLLGNQPRMRAEPMQGDVLVFRFAGGANIDPARDDHMHDARFEFVSADELVTEWTGWSGGRPDAGHVARVKLTRKG